MNISMIKQFVTPNLKHKNGKIYFLNKYEINKEKHNYVDENYYYDLNEINHNINDYSFENTNYDIEIILNDYCDDILIKFNVDDNCNESNIKNIMDNINLKLCELDNNQI